MATIMDVSAEESFKAGDNNTYSKTPEYPNDLSYVSDSGVRYFTEHLGDRWSHVNSPWGIYRMLPRPQLLQKVAEKSSVEIRTVDIAAGRLMVSHASFQAYKTHNEDRAFVHEFSGGLLFGVLDGHCGPDLSKFAAGRLPLHLADTFTQAIVNHPTTESVSSAFRTAFATFDESLSRVFEKFPDRKDGPWRPEDVHEILGPKSKESEPDSVFGAMRRAVMGTTALVGYISNSKKDLWVASLGDSEAFIGRPISDDHAGWNATPLHEFHNTTNQDEVNRLIREHPGEDVVRDGRLLGFLTVTRAFGDFHFKVKPNLRLEVLCYAYPCPIVPSMLKEWEVDYTTPPYISCEPSVRHHSLSEGDIIVLVSDGVRNSEQFRDSSLEDRGKLLVSLSGVKDSGYLDEWSEKIGHSFIPGCEGDNTAERVLHNVLFGEDDRKLAREVTMEFPGQPKDPGFQDDITVMVVEFPKTNYRSS